MVVVALIGSTVGADILIPTYRVDPIILGLLLGALLVLLGVEAGQRLLR